MTLFSSISSRTKPEQKNHGFLLVEVLVSLVLIGSLLGLLVLTLNRSDHLYGRLGRSDLNETRRSGMYKLLGEYTTDAIGKKVCPVQVDGISIETFDTKLLTSFRIIDVASTTEVVFIRTIKDRLYVGLDSSSSTDPDILVFNQQTIESRVSPGRDIDISKDESVFSLDSGPGVRSVIVAGNILFVLASGTTEHIKMFHIDQVGLPQLQWSYKLPVAGAVARSISFDAVTGRLFIGLEKNSGHEFFALQLDSNAVVQRVSSREIGGAVNYIYSLQNHVYVLNTLDPEVIIYDAKTLDRFGEYDATGVVGNGKRIDQLGDGFVFGRTIFGNEVSFVYPTTTSSSSLGLYEGWGTKIRASVDDILAVDGGFILSSTQVAGQVDLYKEATSGDESYQFNSIKSFNLQYGRGTDIFCDRKNFYFTARYEPVFYVLPIKKN